MSATSLDLLHLQLKSHGIHAELTLNDNRNTVLSIRRSSKRAKISLHRMFLAAPQTVLVALAEDIRKGKRSVSKTVRHFIEEKRSEFDYSHLLRKERLVTQGSVYDIQAMYDRLNEKYFQGSLALSLTYFGTAKVKNRSRCSLGLYYDSLKLVKIHRILDSEQVPEYVIEFVVYHEMVHAVSRPFIDDKGKIRAHGKPFKELERQYEQYTAAEEWIKKNKLKVFF